MLLLASILPAAALDLSTAVLPVEEARAVTAWEDRVVVSTGSRVELRDADGVGPLHSWSVDAFDLAVVELDGRSTLLACGERGLWQLSLDAPSIRLSTTACAGVAEGGVDEIVFGDGLTLSRLRFGMDTGASGELEAHDLVGWPLLALSAGRLAAAGREGGTLLLDEGDGIASMATGMQLHGLAWLDDQLWLADAGSGALRTLEGDALAIVVPPGRLLAGDLDGDGPDDLVVVHEEGEGVVVLSERMTTVDWLDVALIPRDLAVGELDGDGCLELLVADSEGQLRRVDATCDRDDDGDGDGFSPDEGDCDDTDASIRPGAPEDCDGIDQDCDGRIDESERIVLDLPATAAEGAAVSGTARIEGCELSASRWAWDDDAEGGSDTGAPPLADCSFSGPQVDCTLHDDGVLVLSVAALGADFGLLLSLEQRLEIQGVAPTLVDTGPLSRGILAGELRIEAGSAGVEQLRAEDPGADTASFSIQPTTAQVSLNSEGLLAVSGETVGAVDLELILQDEDGARSALPFTLVVEESDDDDSGGYDDDHPDTGDWGLDFGECGCGSSTRAPAPDDDDDDVASCVSAEDCGSCAGDVVLFVLFFPFSLIWLSLRR